MTPLILAIPDLDSEPDLVASAALHGVVVARRSFDAADLLAAAAADTSMAVALSAGIPRLSGDLVGRIIAGIGDGEIDAVTSAQEERPFERVVA